METLEQKVLRKALEVAGSEKVLGRLLQVSSHDLALFLAGSQRPTRSVFLAACDLLIERGHVGMLAPLARDLTVENEEDGGSQEAAA